MTIYDTFRIIGDSLMFTITLVCFLVPMKKKKAWGFFWLLFLELFYRIIMTTFQIREPVLTQTYRFVFYFIYMVLRMLWFQCFTKNPAGEFIRVYISVTITSSAVGLLSLLLARYHDVFMYLIADRPLSWLTLGCRLSGALISIICVIPIYRLRAMQNIWNKPIGLAAGIALLLGEMASTLFNVRYGQEAVVFLYILFLAATIWMGIQYTGMEQFKNKVELNNIELEREIQIKYIYYQKLGEQREEIRKIRHDLANHLQVVRGLREKNEYNEAKKYQDKIMQSYFKLEEIEKAADQKTSSVLEAKNRIRVKDYGLNIVLLSNSILLVVILMAIRFWELDPKTALLIEIVFCGGCLIISFCKIYREKKRERILNRHFSSGIEKSADKEIICRLNELVRTLPELSESEETAFIKEIDNYRGTVFTGNPAVDEMLRQKAVSCKENAIAFQCKLSLPEESVINTADLIGLIGNLFDNAIEACMRFSGERFVYLESRAQAGVFMIKVVNSKPSEEYAGKNGFITHKEDKETHGIGMKIVAEIVKIYGGIVEYSEKNTEFTATVSLLQKRGT